MILSWVLAWSADSISVELITIGPGEQFFQLHGHAALRVKSHGCDSIFSFETDPGRSAVMQYLAGNRGAMVAESTPRFLDSIGSTGRGVRAYKLNITPQESERLIRLLRSEDGREQSRFNMRSANCTTQLFDLIDSAISPTRVTPGKSPQFRLPAARFYTDTLRRDAPWVSALITLALGTAADDSVTTVRSISPLLFDDQYRHITISPSGRPLVKEAREIYPRRVEITAPAVTPVHAAIALSIMLIAATILSLAGKAPRIVAMLDTVTFGIIFLLGALIAFATFSPYSVGHGGSLTLTVINPLIIFLPALHRDYPKATRIIVTIWAAWLIIYALWSPHITAETLPSLRLLAPALAARLLSYGRGFQEFSR